MSERSPTLAEVVNVAIERGARSIRVSMPGRIEKFNATEQTADVKPLLYDHVENEDGSESNDPVDVISRVPVIVIGGGGYAATFPIAAGDECELVFGDRSLDIWFDRGGDVDPIDLRRHALSDAVAIVGLRSKGKALSEYDTTRAVFGNNGPRVACDGSIVHLGVTHNQSATEAAVLGNAQKTAIESLMDSIGTATTSASTTLLSVTALMSTATVANAVPIVGGAIAAAPFAAVAAAIAAAGTSLQSIATAVNTFKTQQYLSSAVKVK